MPRNQRLTPLQPIFDAQKILGAQGTGNSATSYVRAVGGAVTASGPTLVEHTFTASGPFNLLAPGTLMVGYVITGTGTFDGNSVSGATSVTGSVAAVITSGSIVVSYDPSTDWVPA